MSNQKIEPMRSRNGFTLIELLIVLILIGIVGGMAVTNVGRTMSQTRVQRAASVIATDLRLAHSMAARQRRPVVIAVDGTNRVIRVRDAATPTTVYSERHFGTSSELPVQLLTATPATVQVNPNGLAAGPIAVTVRWADRTRVVKMSRAGMVRVSGS